MEEFLDPLKYLEPLGIEVAAGPEMLQDFFNQQ